MKFFDWLFPWQGLGKKITRLEQLVRGSDNEFKQLKSENVIFMNPPKKGDKFTKPYKSGVMYIGSTPDKKIYTVENFYTSNDGAFVSYRDGENECVVRATDCTFLKPL